MEDGEIVILAQNVLKQEAEALLSAAQRLDDNIAKAVTRILAIPGRVVVTGVGKSALIGQKMVATFNSTGQPALFLHAADAIHGDLGMVQAGDLVLALSNSGNTPEIRVLLPYLQKMGIPIIALTGETNSFLGSAADVVLDAHVEQEACPNNLAPTTSTTLALALGDALAVCLLQCRNFTQADFARYHPGGAIGKKLFLQVTDLYPNNELPIVPRTASLRELIYEISSKRLGATAVVEADGRLAGIVTDGDLRRLLEKEQIGPNLTAADLMSINPKTIAPDALATEATLIMEQRNITQLIVVDVANHPVGFIHLHDLVREGIVGQAAMR